MSKLPGPTATTIKVLVVDDSALVRQVLSAVLGQDRSLAITTAANPIIALRKMSVQRPDVIVLDIEMPEMNGLTFLEKVIASDPLPVVICSEYADRGSERAIRALELGAVEIVTKPHVGLQGFLQEASVQLLDTIKAAAQARVRPKLVPKEIQASPKLSADVVLPPSRKQRASTPTDTVVAIGASTGGTEALLGVLQAMPEGAPGMVIVQHMPEGFTAAFARRLDKSCRIEVKEAVTGDEVLRGRALLAPGNQHMLLQRRSGGYCVEVVGGPLVSRHRPSVDVLFRSVAQAAGRNAIGMIMTGMGDDGANGLLEMRQAGAFTMAQDEASSVVFGMPKVAIEIGAVVEVHALSALPGAILRRLRGS